MNWIDLSGQPAVVTGAGGGIGRGIAAGLAAVGAHAVLMDLQDQSAAVDAIVAAIGEMLPIAARSQRETRPASELVLALQCGGSDGSSALTANPALGAASDILVRNGGTSIGRL